jgi:hypothetical protein
MKMSNAINVRPRKDTSAWVMQVWAAFLVAVGVSGFGILATPGDIWMKGYLLLAFAFVLSSTFTLSKTMRDNQHKRVDTGQWVFQVWAAFLLAGGLSLFGVMNLPGDPIYKGFGLMALAFSVSASFTLAKTIRDNHEAAQFDKADANGDGVLDATEASNTTFASRFNALDKNGDGVVSKAELK